MHGMQKFMLRGQAIYCLASPALKCLPALSPLIIPRTLRLSFNACLQLCGMQTLGSVHAVGGDLSPLPFQSLRNASDDQLKCFQGGLGQATDTYNVRRLPSIGCCPFQHEQGMPNTTLPISDHPLLACCRSTWWPVVHCPPTTAWPPSAATLPRQRPLLRLRRWTAPGLKLAALHLLA
jgi:hypothetical protein